MLKWTIAKHLLDRVPYGSPCVMDERETFVWVAGLQRIEGIAVNMTAGAPEESWQKLSFVLDKLTVRSE
jgi:hypothetical protein